MDEIIGNPRPIRIGRKVYLVSYVSMAEWRTFGALDRISNEDALLYLLYSALHRGDSQVTKAQVKWLLRRHQKFANRLVDMICDISLPKLKARRGTHISDREAERNVKTVYRVLSRMHGWAPDIISGMAPVQVYVYLTGGPTGTGIVKMSSAQYQNFLATRGIGN